MFDEAEFTKLSRDFDRSRMTTTMNPAANYYVIYALDSPSEGEELCLYFHEVERITRDEQGNNLD